MILCSEIELVKQSMQYKQTVECVDTKVRAMGRKKP